MRDVRNQWMTTFKDRDTGTTVTPSKVVVVVCIACLPTDLLFLAPLQLSFPYSDKRPFADHLRSLIPKIITCLCHPPSHRVYLASAAVIHG